MNVVVNTDGACAGNPGPMGIGVIGWREGQLDQGSVIELSEYIGHGTNNLAEYRAIVRALETCLKIGATRVRVNCDALIVVRQIQGDYKCNVPSLDNERRNVLALTTRFTEGVTFYHIYDDHNAAADRLARSASKRGRNS